MIEPQWQKKLNSEFKKDYMKNLKAFLAEEASQNKVVYPSYQDVYAAFKASPFEKTKVVIIGQDPYHGPGQAHGLSFSVQPGVKTPPSLVNIYKELNKDLNFKIPDHGHLQSWANQGVLLLNAVLTVEKAKAASHQKKGWEQFTDKVIEILNTEKENLVFLLWGSSAHKKGINIDTSKHLVLKSVHPSPLSAHRGFFGNHHFSKTNEYLISKNIKPINWQIP